jgi:hypothetical protein
MGPNLANYRSNCNTLSPCSAKLPNKHQRAPPEPATVSRVFAKPAYQPQECTLDPIGYLDCFMNCFRL